MFNLPLKTEENPKGIYSEHELYMVLAIIFVCIVRVPRAAAPPPLLGTDR